MKASGPGAFGKAMAQHFPFGLITLALALAVTIDPCLAASSVTADHVTLSISLESATAPDKTVWAAITQTIAPGWHTYWRNPGDSGLPTTVSWKLPSGVIAGEPLWPVPEQFVTDAIVNFGYRDRAILIVPLTMTRTTSVHGTTAQATLSLLECEHICIPETVSLDLDLNRHSGSPAIFAKARAALPRTFNGGVSATSTKNILTITMNSNEFRDVDASTLRFYPATPSVIDYGVASQIDAVGTTIRWHAVLSRSAKRFNRFEGVLSGSRIGSLTVSAVLESAPASER